MTEKEQHPIVEPNPEGDAPARRALAERIRQQEILSELGVLSLQHTTFEELLDKTAQLVAEGLQADYSKVMQHLPDEKRLLVRAGVGWPEGIVGRASVGADLASPAGFALRTGKPVISNHLENEERFRTPELLVQHGVRRAMNVILQGDRTPFGVLEVDSRSEGEFVQHDLAFLQGAANILGMAIERQHHGRCLKLALERQKLLLSELNHRVKNSLSIVSSMLSLQANTNDDENLKLHLGKQPVGSQQSPAHMNASTRLLISRSWMSVPTSKMSAVTFQSRMEPSSPWKRLSESTYRWIGQFRSHSSSLNSLPMQ